LGASIWLIAFWAAQRFGRISDRVTMLIAIAGNAMVSLAWFGAGIMASNLHGSGIGSYWALAVFVGIHGCLLGMGLAPMVEPKESPAGASG
jgi:hypothetical protein